MESVETNRVVTEELQHIPRGSIAQNAFRAAYNAYRRHDLSMDPAASAAIALASAEASVKQVQPTFAAEFDRDYFSRSSGIRRNFCNTAECSDSRVIGVRSS